MFCNKVFYFDKIQTKGCIMENYDDYIVCFLDILGFSNIIKTKNKNEIINIYSTIEEALRNISLDAELLENDIKIVHFSDSIVISYNIKSQDQLVFIIMELQEMIINLLAKDILLRGAITRGGFYHENNKLFGPALVEAYELESQVAVYPRVIISRDVLWYEKFSEELEEPSKNKIIESVIIDETDGWHYIDYISFSPNLWGLDTYQRYISNLLNLITSQTDKSLKIKGKLSWLNRKANQALSLLEEEKNIGIADRKKLKNLQEKCKNNARKLYSNKALI